jgi:hypothetical protein
MIIINAFFFMKQEQKHIHILSNINQNCLIMFNYCSIDYFVDRVCMCIHTRVHANICLVCR